MQVTLKNERYLQLIAETPADLNVIGFLYHRTPGHPNSGRMDNAEMSQQLSQTREQIEKLAATQPHAMCFGGMPHWVASGITIDLSLLTLAPSKQHASQAQAAQETGSALLQLLGIVQAQLAHQLPGASAGIVAVDPDAQEQLTPALKQL
jgi:hypothetical protein